MGEYVDLPGVKTWYEVEGDGEALLLLHGGLCTNETWEAQRAAFTSTFKVFFPERRAHGHTPDVDGPLTYQDMAADTIDFLDQVVGGPAHLVGWSDGGIVALLVAIARPDLTRKVVAVGANFLPAPQASVVPDMLDHLSADDPALGMFRSMYEASSPDGAEHWSVVVDKATTMFRTQPTITTSDLAKITAPTLIVASDDDVVTLEHTIALYRAVPDSQLAIMPGTSHALLMEKPDLANRVILDFVQNDPIPTMIPIRRAPADAEAPVTS